MRTCPEPSAQLDFSECRQFIDTPVKRYSSGMYVKLAFSVAAHLDSEIMIMDEVLAVGDMAFQRKCIAKMSEISKAQGRTILYVSHNMGTIRQLCDRCIVLDHGHLIFDGDVDKAISLYLDTNIEEKTHYSFRDNTNSKDVVTGEVKVQELEILDKTTMFYFGSRMKVSLAVDVHKAVESLQFRFIFLTSGGMAVAATTTERVCLQAGKNQRLNFELDISHLAPACYYVKIIAAEIDDAGIQIRHDRVAQAFAFTIQNFDGLRPVKWDCTYWGNYAIDLAKTLGETAEIS